MDKKSWRDLITEQLETTGDKFEDLYIAIDNVADLAKVLGEDLNKWLK